MSKGLTATSAIRPVTSSYLWQLEQVTCLWSGSRCDLRPARVDRT
jgi:hypothetical protein